MSSIDVTNILAEHLSNSTEHLNSASDAFNHFVDFATKLPPGTTGADASQGWGTAQMGQYIGAGIAMIGAIGVGASHGYAAGSAAIAVGRNPEAQPKILNTLIIGMAITESTAIYSLIIAILIIFVA